MVAVATSNFLNSLTDVSGPNMECGMDWRMAYLVEVEVEMYALI